jgi:hypothetical protein
VEVNRDSIEQTLTPLFAGQAGATAEVGLDRV